MPTQLKVNALEEPQRLHHQMQLLEEGSDAAGAPNSSNNNSIFYEDVSSTFPLLTNYTSSGPPHVTPKLYPLILVREDHLEFNITLGNLHTKGFFLQKIFLVALRKEPLYH